MAASGSGWRVAIPITPASSVEKTSRYRNCSRVWSSANTSGKATAASRPLLRDLRALVLAIIGMKKVSITTRCGAASDAAARSCDATVPQVAGRAGDNARPRSWQLGVVVAIDSSLLYDTHFTAADISEQRCRHFDETGGGKRRKRPGQNPSPAPPVARPR